MRYRKESIVIALLSVSLTLGIGPWLGAVQAMECTTDAFNALGLKDEEFGIPVTSITALINSTISYPFTVIEYCDVKGTMSPEITFEVMLPTTTWNQRLYMVGNGLQAGSIPRPLMVHALWQGYAVTGTDTGHDAAKYPDSTYADPAYNPNWDQATKDFAYRSVHETAVMTKKIIQAYYGSAPVYSYWVGCSTGGRQGLKEAQKYPDDFDGIVAGDPVNNWTELMLGPAELNPQAPTGSQNQIPPDKLPMLGKAVYDKCDGIDGLMDGIIDDPRNCTFDPDQDLQKCLGDLDGPVCFTVAQVIAIEKIYNGDLSNGALIMPGILKGSEAFPHGQGWYGMFVDTTLEQTQRYQITSGNFKHALWMTFPPDYDFLTQWNWDTDPPKLAARDHPGDAVDPDLSAFKARGGKLLMYHGWADPGPNPLATSIAYFNSVYNLMGNETNNVLAFYMVPGMAHCGGGVGCGTVDWFTPLMNWVEKGIAPGSLIGSSTTSLARTRPICRYPEVARYSGTGSTDDAANFVCVPPIINTITASAGEGGSITPAGAVTVGPGGIQGYTITMDPGHTVTDVLVDGVSAGAITSYLFTNVRESHTIAASFGPLSITVNLTQTVVDTAGNPVVGAQVEVVGNPSYSAVTDATGTFVLTIPKGITFAYSISKTGVRSWYSESYLNLTSSVILGNRIIYTDAGVSGWGVNPGYGALRGRALDAGTSQTINNPTVTAASTQYPGISYTVKYESACGSGTGTCLYTVINVAANDAVLLTVSAPGYITKQVQLNPLPADAVGQAFAYLQATTASYDLNLTMTGTGIGTIAFSPGFNCSGTCRQEYGSGETVRLNAVAISNSTFNGWTGCDVVYGDGTFCMVSMTSARSVSADFSRQGTGTGTVYGRITDSSGSGVANASVGMTREYDNGTCSGSNCIHASTNGSGNYLISNIVPGTYTLRFLNQPVPYGTSGGFISTVNQWYNNKHSIASADLMPISEGGQLEFDAVFPLFGQVAGTITDTNGAGIANVDAMVFDLDEQYIDDGYTDASGNYTAQHLPTGTYKIRFRANTPRGLIAAQNLVTQVAYVTVTAPDIVTGINATLSPGRSISGTLTNKDGLPITAGVHVIDSNGLNIAGVTTDATGAYTTIGIPPGSYKVLFMPTLPSTGVVDVTRLYSRKFYGGSADYDSASVVTVTADADVSNIDGVLDVNGPSINSSGTAVAAVRYKWDFGVEVVGMSSYRSIMLANLGTADLSLGALAAIGQDFSILNDRCSGVTLAPQEICTLQVSFVPQSEGMKTGAINVPSNDPNVPVFTISLTGSGGAATGNSGAIAVPYGNNIAVAPTSEVNLTFTSVTSAEGMATATAITTLTSPVPSNFRMLNGTSYDITTTAPYSGPITVCITYDPATMANPSNEQNLKLFHLNGSVWQDITTSVDTIAKKVCGLTDSLSPFLIAEPTTDTTPDPFSFIDQTSVALNTAITSNAIAVAGINAPSAISVNGGQYSINNGVFTSAAGTVNNGDSVRVQLTSSAAYATTKNATLTIGGVSGTFNVTTQSAPIDTTPDHFSFVDQTGVALNTVITSNAITVSGINAPASISITGGQYSINGSAFTSAAGTINSGNSVRVQLTSSANYATTTSTTLTIGGVSGTFSVTTMAIPVYTITATAGTGGSISPPGITTLNTGGSQTYTITPNAGYHIADVSVDGVSQGAVTTYPFTNVQANHTISASFTVESNLSFSVRAAIIKWWNKQQTMGFVTMTADFGATKPANNDVVSVSLDGVQLFSAQFSEFKRGLLPGAYLLVRQDLLVRLDFSTHRLFVATPKMSLVGLDASNGVDVRISVAAATAVENIKMTPAPLNSLIYRRTGVDNNEP